MNRSIEFDRTEISDVAVIQFGNYVDRLLFLSFFKLDRHYEFPLNVRFRDVGGGASLSDDRESQTK